MQQIGLAEMFFDFSEMARMNDDGYFPYTPATNLLRGLRASVDLLLKEGLDNVHKRHFRLAEGVRRAVFAWGLSNVRCKSRTVVRYSDRCKSKNWN